MTPSSRCCVPMALMVVVLMGTQAQAQPPKQKPWIHLEVSATLLRSEEQQELKEQLANAVGERGFELAFGDEAFQGEPIAHIAITGGTGSVVAVRIEIADEVTTKTVSRSVELQTIPRDGWVLTLVLSADELLRASWAELLIEDAPEPKVEVPKQVMEAVEETVTSEFGRPGLIWGVGASGGMYSSGWMGLGIDARLGLHLGSRTVLLWNFKWQHSPTYESENASLKTDLLTGALGVQVEFSNPKAAFGIGGYGLLEFGGLRFTTLANEGFDGHDTAKMVMLGEIGLDMWVDLAGFVRPFLEIGVSIPIRGTEGLDGSETIASLGGIGGTSVIGVCFLFGR